jgi:predicted branched-subunit amino acid permease
MSLLDPAHAVRDGARDAVGVPALIIAASFLGFGSLCRESGFSLWLGLASTATAWALPGQIVLVEFYAVGASLAAILLAVALTNARLLPMTVVLMPMLRAPGTPRWQYFAISHLIAVTGWTRAMQHFPALPPAERLPYYTGFGLVLWGSTLVATAAGFLLATHVPDYVTLGLVFLNPMYFMLVFIADARHAERALALGLGAVCGPLLHLVDADWGLLATGLGAGTVAFVIDQARRRKARGSRD